MLVDFGDIKKTVQQWIDDNLDHNMLLCRDDPILPVLLERGERVFVMDCNPTAENIARLIYDYNPGGRAAGRRVVLWETEHCFSTYSERVIMDESITRGRAAPIHVRPIATRTQCACPWPSSNWLLGDSSRCRSLYGIHHAIVDPPLVPVPCRARL